MRLVFLGAPGVGKGTQANLVASRLGQPKISTGDILRTAVAQQTPLGIQAKSYMDRGQLLPDAVVVGLVKEKLAEPGTAKGFLLDGFPRTVPQAEQLAEMLKAKGQGLDRVINFKVPREEVIRRLTGRRSCSQCEAVFHVDSAPPKRGGVCDRCGGALVTRSDDEPETVRKRLSVYEQQTAPLIEYYRQQGLLSEVDGAGKIEDVQRRLLEALSMNGPA